MFVSSGRTHIITEANLQGAPDLLIEIVGDDTREHDEVLKPAIYERHGVAECWIVDPDANHITIYRRSGSAFVASPAGETLTTPLLPGLEIDLPQLFAHPVL